MEPRKDKDYAVIMFCGALNIILAVATLIDGKIEFNYLLVGLILCSTGHITKKIANLTKEIEKSNKLISQSERQLKNQKRKQRR